MIDLDETDRRILCELDEDARMPTAMIAMRLGLARGTVQTRLERLRTAGVMRSHSSRINPGALGYPVNASVHVELDQHQIAATVDAFESIPEVLECFAPAGNTDLLLRVVAKDPDDLYRVNEEIRLCPGVMRTTIDLFLREVIPYRVCGLLTDA